MVKAILFFLDNEKASLGEIQDAAYQGIMYEAKTFVEEFVKDGLGQMAERLQIPVKNGDYSILWICTNALLYHYGYDKVEPVDVEL